jgi:hypothetical protein
MQKTTQPLTPRAVYSSVIVCPQIVNYKGTQVNVLDLPLPAKFLKKELEDGTVEYMTIGEYETSNGYDFPRSADGRYIALYVVLSDLSNENGLFKTLLRDCGVTLGGDDLTQDGDGLAWLLTLEEFVNDFKSVSPLFVTTDSEI